MKNQIQRLVKTNKALGEPTRLKILRMLATRPMYVCELEAVLEMNQPRISQHLRVLREAGLVREERDAQWTRYLMETKYLEQAVRALHEFLSRDLAEIPGFEEERSRLESLESNPKVMACINCNQNERGR